MTIRTHTGAVEKQWAVLYFATVGLAAGFLGSLVKLISNMIGASIMALDPLKLLRVYATIKEGPAALVPNNGISLLDTFFMHLVVGSIFGAVFMIIMSKRSSFPELTAFLLAGCGLRTRHLDCYFLFAPELDPAPRKRQCLPSQ